MATCALGSKKLKKLRSKTGLPIVCATARGGTDHQIQLYLEGGNIVRLFKDGSMVRCAMTWKPIARAVSIE